MDAQRVRRVLAQVAAGKRSAEWGATRLAALPFEDLDFAKVDHHRHLRQGFPEVVLGSNKTPAQIASIAKSLYRQSGIVLVTRVAPAAVRTLRRTRLPMRSHPQARCVVIGRPPAAATGDVLVLTAGTADIPVAEEAALTARLLGARVTRIFDVGVAGVHRLLAHRRQLEQARVLVVVAGMEGALASVAGGLVACPVIAVPTSIGYGASFGGVTALLAMLNSCAPNVLTVNIDDGFGAGFSAGLINRIGD
jgi:NCAIR mutase (PurE)-related protein